MFSDDKLSVLNRIHEKFKNYTGKMLSDYMHKERAFVLIRDATKSRRRQAAKPQRITDVGKRALQGRAQPTERQAFMMRNRVAVAGNPPCLFPPPLRGSIVIVPWATWAALAALRLRLPTSGILRRCRGLTPWRPGCVANYGHVS